MTQQGRNDIVILGMWIDTGVLLAGLMVGFRCTGQPFWNRDVLVIRSPVQQIVLSVLLLWSWHLSLSLAGLYKSLRLASRLRLGLVLVRGWVTVALCTAAWLVAHTWLLRGWISWSSETTALLSLWTGLAGSYLIGTRLIARWLNQWLRLRGRNLRHVLIIGSNPRAIRVADTLTESNRLGYRLIGFIDDKWHSREVPKRYAEALVGDLNSIERLLQTTVVDEVIITLPIASAYVMIRQICHLCKVQGIQVRCEVSLFTFDHQHLPNKASPLQFTNLNQGAWSEWALRVKRVIDIVVALVALCICFPLLAAIAIAVAFTSPGPVLFRQQRLGIGKRTFEILKFRTMVQNAEALMGSLEHLNQSGGPTFKLRNDPRITKIGFFLRKTSLDELPQLFNVLRGDMSLVGPRALPLRDYRGFSEGWHRRRFSVKPGITCLWQVMGRSSIGFERWMELDMSYIDSWSLWLDLKILWQTIPVVIRGSGAF